MKISPENGEHFTVFGCKNKVFRCKNPKFQVQFLHVLGAKMTFFECNFVLVWVQILDSDLLNMLVTAVSKGSSSKRVNLFAPKRFRNCTQNMSFLHPKHEKIAPETWGFCT